MTFHAVARNGGLTVIAHAGNNTVLLGMSLDEGFVAAHAKTLAGFAIWRKEAGHPEQPVLNHAVGEPGPLPPIQRFRWVDVPPNGFQGRVRYRVAVLFFSRNYLETTEGPQVQIEISPVVGSGTLSVGFTRGMFQAPGTETWLRRALRPGTRRQLDFDTKPFQETYEWLGGGARRLLFDFLADCLADKDARLDVFAFQLDEPDIATMLCRLGPRLRVIVDGFDEQANQVLRRTLKGAGARVFTIRRAGFLKYRAMIKRDGATGKPSSVLFGSADFTLYGLYAHPNNVFVSTDRQIASAFADAFEILCTDPTPAEFRRTPVARQDIHSTPKRDSTPLTIAFGPRRHPEELLGRMIDAIRTATESVLFSVSDRPSTIGGAILPPLWRALKAEAANPHVFSYGIAQLGTRLAVQSPEGEMSRLHPLQQIEPEAFGAVSEKWRVSNDIAFGQRFVIVDFDAENPSVFATSANFGTGIGRYDAQWVARIRDPAIVTAFMVEGIRQIDHYDFRQEMLARSPRPSSLSAAAAQPPAFWHPGLEGPAWWEPYYDPRDVKLRERRLVARLPISDDVRSRTRPDWTSLKPLGGFGAGASGSLAVRLPAPSRQPLRGFPRAGGTAPIGVGKRPPGRPAAGKPPRASRAPRAERDAEGQWTPASGRVGRGKTSGASHEPRWLLAQVFDLSAAHPKTPTPAFRAGASHKIQVIIGAPQAEWLVARGRDASESIDAVLPEGPHELTVVFFIPARRIHRTGKLLLPPSGPSPKPATFRFKVGPAGTAIEALISIVYHGRVLQTALLSGKAVDDPRRARKAERIALRLQVLVPALADLDRRQVFDAALVAHTRGTAGVTHSAAGPDKTVVFDQPRIADAAMKIRAVLAESVTGSGNGKLDSQAIWKLAQEGSILHEELNKKLTKELPGRDLTRLQLVQADADAFIPIEFAYGLPPPVNGAGLCKNWKRALAGRRCSTQQHKKNRLTQNLEVVCPSGFWGVSKVIERQTLEGRTSAEMGKSDFAVRAEPSVQRPSLPRFSSALFAWSHKLDNEIPGTSAGVLKSLNQVTRQHTAAAKTWLQWVKAIRQKQPGLLVLLSHTLDDALEIGRENSGETVTLAQINMRYVKKNDQDNPIVFVLGCTTGVADQELVSFAGRFRDQGAALVVGTITPVAGERSAAVVKAVIAKLAQKRAEPARFGELMRDVRRDLLSQGELTALCTTSFGDASWLVG